MRLRIPLLLALTMMTGLGYSTVAAQPPQQPPPPPPFSTVIRPNEDVVCVDCPPGTQSYEMIVTYQISATCTRVDTFHAACPNDCQWTFVSSEHSGSCNGPEPSVAEWEVPPGGPEVENVTHMIYWYGWCVTYNGYIICDPDCRFVCTEIIMWDCQYVTSLKPGANPPDGVIREPAVLSFALSSRNPTSEPVVFRMGVPEASRGAHEELVLFDLLGRRVRTLFSGVAASGSREQRWDLRTDEGVRARPGLYYARYRLGNEERKQSVVIVK